MLVKIRRFYILASIATEAKPLYHCTLEVEERGSKERKEQGGKYEGPGRELE